MTTRFLRNALAASVLLGVLPAGAVTLGANGIGQVLVYPYYTVNKGQDTLITIVNTSAVGKVLQVRFLEGYNGRRVLDYMLFLSPHDVWTAAISQTADDGGAKLATSDASCTIPALPAAGIPFSSAGYDGSSLFPADAGPQGITRTREGFIEIFALADINPGSATDIATTHVQNGIPGDGVPPGCATLGDAMIQADGITPTNGVSGSASIVNVGQGTFFAYNADALQGFTDVPMLSPAADLGVSFQEANNADAVSGVATAHIFNSEGRPLAIDYAFGVDAVSAVFMADAIYNEYVTSSSLSANTDWVVTMPTKEFYVDKDLYPANPTAPFVQAFDAPGQSITDVATTITDREEGTIQQPCQPGFEPPPCEPPIALLYEANVLPFNTGQALTPWPIGAPSGVLGSQLTPFAIDTYGDDGSATLDLAGGDGGHLLPGGIDADGQAMTVIGLPVTGFMVYNIINAHAQPGLLANYGGTFAHRTTMSCVGASALCASVITGGGAEDVR
jgi:hypothetical protein